MFNKDFYPTPKNVALKMIEGLKLSGARVLEPSAGKGDLANVILDEHGYGHYDRVQIHAIEKDPQLQSILRDHERIDLVDTDFLEFQPQCDYDFIIMNPPFSNGLDHFIHAFEIGNSAKVVCLLNSDTVHGKTEKAKMVRTIVEDNKGEIVELGSCFTDAERKTKVNVCMIRVQSEKLNEFEFEFKPQFDREEVHDFSTSYGAELAIRGDVFEDYEKRYNLACKAYAEFLKKGNEFAHYASSISALPSLNDATASYKVVIGGSGQFSDFRRAFRKECWKDLFAKTKIAQYLPSTIKQKFMDQADKQGYMNFTAKNMRNLFMDLYMNQEGIMQQCVENSFDLMTKYHTENRCHIEGWKSNDRWQVSQKVVLPNMRTYYPLGDDTCVDFDYHGFEKFRDIHMGLCWMTGSKLDSINMPSHTKNTDLKLGVWHETEFFQYKMFKKGTVHLKFKDENLWKKFNIQACKAKNWLKGE